MPLYMDRHDIRHATAEEIAQAHHQDIEIQDRHFCKALTYWNDDTCGAAFCLAEAPSASAVQDMHREAHGLVPNQVIEVDPTAVAQSQEIRGAERSRAGKLAVGRSLGGLAALAAVLLPMGGAAQTAVTMTEPPAVISALEGEWDGDGTLMGRPGKFGMIWRVLNGGFARLSFDNAFVAENGQVTPVLRSEATYLFQGLSAQGVWIDDRPQRIRLDAVVTDSSLVTTWTAESERGRTEYVVRSPDEAYVRDFVEVDGELRPFGEASYARRRDPGFD